MCGIVGFVDQQRCSERSILKRMIGAIRHRGPDAFGEWTEPQFGVAFGHTRLAIVDLSELGAQPMTSPSGRYVIVFNGEVFNFRYLARELESYGHVFRGGSDTEVMLAAFEQWGIAGAVEKFVGMFAFAVWDRQESEISLVRDRLGIKPLYYGWLDRSFVFASELHALRGHPLWRGHIRQEAIGAMLELGYVPAPQSAVDGIFKLPPGSMMTLTIAEASTKPAGFSPNADGGAKSPRRFWNPAQVIARSLANPLEGSADSIADELDMLLKQVIELRLISDVPLGAFLSGGIDSSLLVSIMQQLSTQPVRTFCIGFDVPRYDEAKYGSAVAKHLGTDHTELYVTSQQARDVVPSLARMFDEPFGDSSQIPTYLVSALCRKHVTVALSGDGGDELFGGYTRFSMLGQFWKRLAMVPPSVRRLAGAALGAVPPRRWDGGYEFLHRAGVTKRHVVSFGDKLQRVLSAIGAEDETDYYYRALAIWPRGNSPLLQDVPRWMPEIPPDSARADKRASLMYSDLVSYLPDDILVKTDRASMAVALEARVPFLDHRVVEFAWRIPLQHKFREGRSKWILRKVLDRYVPKELVDRPKVGFSVPLDAWLRDGLKDWAESQLSERRLREEGIFDCDRIREVWRLHSAGRHDKSAALWNVLMVQSWKEELTRPLGEPRLESISTGGIESAAL